MQNKNFSKIKKQNPVSIIVHSTNIIGNNLAQILLEQGSKVVLVDKFDSKSKSCISELKKMGDADFVDISGLEDLMKNISRVDYIFYIQSEFLLDNDYFTSKDFLEESNNLNICLKAAQKDNSKFGLVTSIPLNEKLARLTTDEPTSYSPEELQKYSETLAAEYHDKSKVNVRIIRLGTVLGKESNIEKFNNLNQLFEDSVKNDTINIAGEGLDIHYIAHISDIIYGILKLTFASNTNGEVISLCNNNDYTTLSIAYKLLELNSNASEIKFVPNPEKKKVLHSQYIPAPNAEEYGWKQRNSLEKTVCETLEIKYKKHKKTWKTPILSETAYKQKLQEIRTKKTTKSPTDKKDGNISTVATPTGKAVTKTLEKFRHINLKEKFLSISFLKIIVITILLLPLFYFLIYPIFSITGSSISAYRTTKKLTENFSDYDNDLLVEKLGSINKNIRTANRSFNNLNWFFYITQRTEIYNETSMLLYSLEAGSEGAMTLAEGLSPLFRFLNEFEPAMDFEGRPTTTTREYTNILEELRRNSDKVNESSYKISQSLETMSKINSDIYPNVLKNQIEEIQKEIEPLNENVSNITKIVQFLPDSLGIDGRKRYLILLQNPGELRSTGGWISSYAIIGLEGGQIRELRVDDVYNLDGELKNQGKFFAPPEDMREALEIELLGLSLSNWNPNFPDTAKEASTLVKEAGVANRVDGVITIDIYLLQNLLDLWGGLNIPGERDLITSENIYEKVFSLHENFTPGQSQKATFLTNLADEVIRKIFYSNFEENSQIFSVILNSLESKNVLIYFENIQAQRYFSGRGWTGEMSARRNNLIPSSVEWNWGANKANLYLQREKRATINILNANEIDYEYSLLIRNNSSSETYPQGEYKNYLRLYLPMNSKVSSVVGFYEDEYISSYKLDFKVLEGWFNVPISSTKELKINYKTTDTKDILQESNDNIVLNSSIFKQPGTGPEDLLRVEIAYPQNWSILEEDNFDRSRTNLIKQTNLDKDKDVNLRWERR